ncbi:hypothetical protein GCM10007962_07160 [Yeosuana aromativorans]|uniref:Uncharacterized protein n=1 Tax=Yeosuana aromativorans TaxID=288019 RepID=A0A8J3BEH3_9FLAO|nr:hypothetical protein GCM10007962_07160 [Yeosuana aromativorans]
MCALAGLFGHRCSASKKEEQTENHITIFNFKLFHKIPIVIDGQGKANPKNLKHKF